MLFIKFFSSENPVVHTFLLYNTDISLYLKRPVLKQSSTHATGIATGCIIAGQVL